MKLPDYSKVFFCQVRGGDFYAFYCDSFEKEISVMHGIQAKALLIELKKYKSASLRYHYQILPNGFGALIK